jgi:uncharacterized membrane protein YvbJ
MSFCSVCGDEIGNENFCANCGTAQDSFPPKTKNISQSPTYQTQVPSQQGMQGMMRNMSPMMILGVIAMIIMMFFMFIFVFSTGFNFWDR